MTQEGKDDLLKTAFTNILKEEANGSARRLEIRMRVFMDNAGLSGTPKVTTELQAWCKVEE